MSFVDTVAQQSESSPEMVLPCPGKAQSKSTRRVLRDAGAWTSAAVRKNQEVKIRRLHSFRSAEFKSAKDREISNWLANQVTEKAVRTAGLEPHHELHRDGQGPDRVAEFPGPPFGNARHGKSHDFVARALPECAHLGGRQLNKGDVKAVFLQLHA